MFGKILNKWINDDFPDTNLDAAIKNKLQVLTELFDYDVVYILDVNGNFLMSSNGNTPKYLPELEKEALKQSLKTAKTISTEIRSDRVFAYPFYSLITPIYYEDQAIAALWMVMDLRKSLYPLIEKGSSAGAATDGVLFMQQGNHIALLKHSNNKNGTDILKFLPLENSNTIIGQAMNGVRGIFYSQDDTGQKVIAYISSLPKTPWLLITIVNRDNALDKTQKEIFSITLPIIIGLLFIGISVAYKQYLAFKKQRDLNHSLEIEATLDPLTGLVNRRALDKNIEIHWQRILQTGANLSMVMFDVDYFKNYNYHYGHLKGDQCLKKIANIAKQMAMRSTDTVARYGGEEFIILLPNTSLDDAIQIANKLRQMVYNAKIEHVDSDYEKRLTISVGVACINGADNKNMSWQYARRILITQADRALYEAKASGRNTVHV